MQLWSYSFYTNAVAYRFDGGYGGDVGPAIKKLVQKQKLAVGFGAIKLTSIIPHLVVDGLAGVSYGCRRRQGCNGLTCRLGWD